MFTFALSKTVQVCAAGVIGLTLCTVFAKTYYEHNNNYNDHFDNSYKHIKELEITLLQEKLKSLEGRNKNLEGRLEGACQEIVASLLMCQETFVRLLAYMSDLQASIEDWEIIVEYLNAGENSEILLSTLKMIQFVEKFPQALDILKKKDE